MDDVKEGIRRTTQGQGDQFSGQVIDRVDPVAHPADGTVVAHDCSDPDAVGDGAVEKLAGVASESESLVP